MTRLTDRKGFTLIELMLVMAISLFVLYAASRTLTSLITQFKQQSKISETNIESTIGLELLRRDLLSLSFGIPEGILNTAAVTTKYDRVDWSPLVNYAEMDIAKAKTLNDAVDAAVKRPPRPIIATPTAFSFNGSDYFVIKNAIVARNFVSGKWHTLDRNNEKNTWIDAQKDEEDLRDNDRVIVITHRDKENRGLIIDGANFFTTFNPDAATAAYAPVEETEDVRFIYGIGDGNLRAPFNRADYYITDGIDPYASATTVPVRCADGTGVLVKAVMDHADGDFDLDADGESDEIPLMDCVADVQVVYMWGGALADGETMASQSAKAVTENLQLVRIYVLSHEGQKDMDFTYPNSTIRVGDAAGHGRDFDFAAQGITDWEHYRWKVYSIAETTIF